MTASGPDPAPLAETTVGELLARVAAPVPAPGGGAVAAAAVGLAAALCAMVGDLSHRHCDEAAALAEAARALSRRAPDLGDDDARAYLAVMAARRHPGARSIPDGLDAALSAAAEPPLAIAEAGATVATMAARLAVAGNPAVRGDAVTAVLVAAAGCEAAAALVDIDLDGHPADPRRATVAAARQRSRAAAGTARQALEAAR